MEAANKLVDRNKVERVHLRVFFSLRYPGGETLVRLTGNARNRVVNSKKTGDQRGSQSAINEQLKCYRKNGRKQW